MKFTRRHDLDPQTRIEIVKHVWINQGILTSKNRTNPAVSVFRPSQGGAPPSNSRPPVRAVVVWHSRGVGSARTGSRRPTDRR